MRDYAKVSPKFWNGETGKALRAMGPRVQVTAMYLVTCPSSTMLGLYYLPLPTLCHETGSPFKEASESLRRLSEAGFAYYDSTSEHVFVPEMARFQIGEHLSKRDNRHKAVVAQLGEFKKSPYFKHFLEKYRDVYELDDFQIEPFPISPLEAPLETLRSQEQEQEQEQKKEKDIVGLKPDAPALPHEAKPKLSEIAKRVLAFLNEKTGRNYRPVDANLRLIAARLRDGATESELRQVIAKKAREWLADEKMAEYLRPKTLFAATNFAQYQGELVPIEGVQT